MGERESFSVKVDADVASAFREYVQDAKGKLRGELGREVENAMREYMDNDRYTRIERDVEETHEKLDRILATLGDSDTTHTHGRCVTDNSCRKTQHNRCAVTRS